VYFAPSLKWLHLELDIGARGQETDRVHSYNPGARTGLWQRKNDETLAVSNTSVTDGHGGTDRQTDGRTDTSRRL